jgi:hypothetical protein
LTVVAVKSIIILKVQFELVSSADRSTRGDDAPPIVVHGLASPRSVAVSVCPFIYPSAATNAVNDAVAGAEPCINATVAHNGTGAVVLNMTMRTPRLWVAGTRGQAHLYTLTLTMISSQQRGTVLGDGDGDMRSIRFGVRSLELKGHKILHNGERLFLRGYGDDAQYGTTLMPPMDKSFYVHQLRSMKGLGFNFVRFHT